MTNYNIIKGSFEQETEFYTDTHLEKKVITFSLSIPYANDELSELYEEKELISLQHKNKISELRKKTESKVLSNLDNLLSNYGLSMNCENLESINEELNRNSKLFLKALKDKINTKKEIARDEKRSNDNVFNDEAQEEIDRVLKKDIEKINRKQELYKEDLVSFQKFYKKEIILLKESVNSQIEKTSEELEPIIVEIKKNESVYYSENQNRFNGLLLKFKSITMNDFQRFVDKNNDEIIGFIHIVYHYNDGHTTESTNEYDDIFSFESALELVSVQTESIERKRRIKEQADILRRTNVIEEKILSLQDNVETNIEFRDFIVSVAKLSVKITQNLNSLKQRAKKAIKYIKRESFFEKILGKWEL